MHFPLSGSPKHKGLFDCPVKIKNDLLQLFCGIPLKIGKMFINSYILSFVFISSGKTKFSMASCNPYNSLPVQRILSVSKKELPKIKVFNQ